MAKVTDFPLPKGRVPTNKEWKAIEEWQNSNRVIQGLNNTISDADGQGKRIDVQSGSSGANATQFPFQLIDASKNGSTNIRIRYGTVNGMDPAGMSVGDNPPYVLTGLGSSGRVWVELDFTVSSGIFSATAASLDSGSDVPDDDLPDGDGDGKVYRQLGNWSTSSGSIVIAQDVQYSLIGQICGGVNVLWGPG